MFRFLVLSGLFLGMGVLVCTPVWGDTPCVGGDTATYLCVTPPSAETIPEDGNGIAWFPFTVANYTGDTLALDIAAWIITPEGPDDGDTVIFGGPGTFYVYLTPGEVALYNWPMDLANPGSTCPADCDYGDNSVSFSIEMTNYIGSLTGLPLGAQSSSYPPTWIASGYLGSSTFWGLSTVDGSTVTVSDVTVYDTPEPSSTLMLGGYAILALLGGCAWRKRQTR
jgi:hypothetical protein